MGIENNPTIVVRECKPNSLEHHINDGLPNVRIGEIVDYCNRKRTYCYEKSEGCHYYIKYEVLNKIPNENTNK